MKKTKTTQLILCALFAALTAVFSQIVIPLAPVPINLATLAVFLAGGLLGGRYGALSQTIYLLLGAVGVPVFTMFGAGLGILMGPTGGYIIGYITAAWLTGFITDRFGKTVKMQIFAMIAGLLSCYLLGTTWFIYSTKTGFVQALMLCVIPFLFGDALKITVASILVSRLRPVIHKQVA